MSPLSNPSVLMVSSDRPPCGVYDYTDRLQLALAHQGIRIQRIDPRDSPLSISPMDDPPDLIHFQFQSSLYPDGRIDPILTDLPDLPIVVTFHDRAIPPLFPFHRISHAICPNVDIAHLVSVPDLTILPLGIPLRGLRILSFGLGRTQGDLVVQACLDAKCFPEVEYRNRDGSQTWLPCADLDRLIDACDLVVFWYPDDVYAGSSFAARVALGRRRPVVANRVQWFLDLGGQPNVTLCDDTEDLVVAIRRAAARSSPLPGTTMADVAERHLTIYREVCQKVEGKSQGD